MTANRWFRATILLGALLLVGGAISTPSPALAACLPCDDIECARLCERPVGCTWNAQFRCYFCICGGD
jgi:hypothetical protein